MKILVFSDVHIGGKFNEEMFLKGVDLINNTDADFYIFAGDLTDQGTLQEYKLVTEKYLPMIKKPILLIPGNHDVKNVGDLLWEEYIGPRYFVHSDEKLKVKLLGLDSNEPDMNTGRIGERGIKRIYKEFSNLPPGWKKILVFHHQTLPIKYTGRERSAITDAGDVIKAILDCDVDIVINGHRHISNVYQLADSDYTTLVVNCGTMSCKKTRYKEEYTLTLIDFEDNHAEVDIIQLNSKMKTVTRFKGRKNMDIAPENIKEEGTLISRIIQIGNTEFSDSEFQSETFAKMIGIVNVMSCDVVVHCGDVTDSSKLDEFSMSKIFLGMIQHPLLIVPGPKDYYPLGQELFRKLYLTTNPEMDVGKLRILGFNTCILEDKIGRLGRSSMRYLKNRFDQTDLISVVAFHHNIIPLARTKHESELQDAGDVLDFLVKERVQLVLTGAKNTSGTWKVGDTIISNCGTASSDKIVNSKGNSFNIIEIYEYVKDTVNYLVVVVKEYFILSDTIETIGKFIITKKVA